MATLPDMLRAEWTRCQNLAQTCAQLGTAGAFASALLAESLQEAEQALRLNEAAAIERAMARLRSFRDVTPERREDRSATRPRFEARPVAASAQPQRAYTAAARPAAWGAARSQPQEQFFTWTRAA